MQGLCGQHGRNNPEIGGQMDVLKMILDQAAGVAIAILLIMRIENKLDGLTNAVVKLSEVIRPAGKN